MTLTCQVIAKTGLEWFWPVYVTRRVRLSWFLEMFSPSKDCRHFLFMAPCECMSLQEQAHISDSSRPFNAWWSNRIPRNFFPLRSCPLCDFARAPRACCVWLIISEYEYDPLCETQAKVSKSNDEITSIKVGFLPLISIFVMALLSQYYVFHRMLFTTWRMIFVKNNKSQKTTLAGFSQRGSHVFTPFIFSVILF